MESGWQVHRDLGNANARGSDETRTIAILAEAS